MGSRKADGRGSGPRPTIWTRQRFAEERTQTETFGEIGGVGGRATAAIFLVLTGAERGRIEVLRQRTVHIGREASSDLALTGPGVSRRHARIERREGGYWLEDLDSSNGTFVDQLRVEGRFRLISRCRLRFGPRTVLEFFSGDEMAAQVFEEVRQGQLLDPLTGVGNRAFLDQRLREEIAFAARCGSALGVMMLDVDRFKSVNDQFGHAVGDTLLRELGGLLLRVVRVEDAVFRYGGDEFCILVREGVSRGLIPMADRVLSAIRGMEIECEDGTLRITASIGLAHSSVATDRPTPSTDDSCDMPPEYSLVRAADQALYLAKDSGGDQARIATST